MSDEEGSFPALSVIWPGLAAALAAAMGYYALWAPLESARPSLPAAPAAATPRGEEVYARLWDDPLRSWYRPGDQASRLSDDPPRPQSPAARRAARADAASKTDCQVLLLPVFLPGGPSAVAVEERMRTRYAVLSALTVARYRPLRAESLRQFLLWMAPEKECLPVAYEQLLPIVNDSLYERNAEVHFHEIVLCWLDESRLNRHPLQVLDRLAAEVKSRYGRANVHVHVVGPAASDMLLDMANELAEHPCLARGAVPIEFYSARATLEPAAVKHVATWIGFNVEARLQALTRDGGPAGGDDAPPRYRFYGVIGTDWHLAHALKEELQVRDHWPDEPHERMVVITERDTLYGRAMPYLFSQLFASGADPPIWTLKYLRGIDGRLPHEPSAQADGASATRARADRRAGHNPTGRPQLDYLRRLRDGLLRLQGRLDKEIVAIGVLGSDVYDKLLILRALRESFPRAAFFTTDWDANFLRDSESRFTHNLLVASHFGPALHPRLQRDAPPFRGGYQTATYLASLLAVRDDRAWGAVTGGKFELSAARKTPPSSASGGVLPNLALWPRPLQEKEDEHVLDYPPAYHDHHLRPLVFEIGRRGPYQLTLTRGENREADFSYYESPPREDGAATFALVQPLGRQRMTYPWSADAGGIASFLGMTIAFLGLLGLHVTALRKLPGELATPWRRLLRDPSPPARGEDSPQFKTEWGRPALLLTLAISPAILLAAFGRDLVAPARNLPTTLRVLACLLLAGVALGYGVQRAGRRKWDWVRVVVQIVLVVFSALLAAAIWRDHAAPFGEPWSVRDGVSVWPSTVLRYLAFLFSAGAVIRGLVELTDPRKKDADEKPFKCRFSAAASGRIRDCWNIYRRRERKEDDKTKLCDALEFHRQAGGLGCRVARVAGCCALYILFSMSLFAFTDAWPNVPARSAASRGWTHAILWLSVAATVAHVFFVNDALLLTQRWARQLREVNDWGAPSGKRARVGELQAAAIHLIGIRSQRVTKMTIWPCVTLLLMILARHRVFDHWDFPWPLLVVFGLLFLSLILQTLALYREAWDTKDAIAERLRRQLAAKLDDDARRRLEESLRQVEQEREGAYRPWSQDNLLKGLAIPFGGTGGILLLEQILHTS